MEKGARGGTQGIIAGNKSTIPGAENISGAVKQTGPIFIGGHPKDASASFGASVRRGDFFCIICCRNPSQMGHASVSGAWRSIPPPLNNSPS